LKSRPPDVWVKIADFGLTKCVEDELGITNTLKGTMGFIAPELYGFTARTTDYAIDIWALGGITFQMLTRAPSFRNLAMVSQYARGLEAFLEYRLPEHNIGTQAVDFVQVTMQACPPQGQQPRKAYFILGCWTSLQRI
jgi:serine/threonine protein kinase